MANKPGKCRKMNAKECAAVQRLISDLDDTRLVYTQLEPLLFRSHLRFLISWMIQVHASTADDLVGQMLLVGGLAARRGGGARARYRAKAERWISFASMDIELACLKRIARHEDRVTLRFQRTMAEVQGLHQNLQRELLRLERARFRIESMVAGVEAPSSTFPRQPAAIANTSNREISRR